MALIGGGGAGNVAGGNPSGTGSGLTYIGDHAYFSPSALAAQTAEVVVGQFVTGAHYIIGTFTFNPAIQLSNPADIDGAACEIRYNDEVVTLLVTGNNTVDSALHPHTELLIPPYTTVKVTVRADAADVNNFVTAFFVGRVYA